MHIWIVNKGKEIIEPIVSNTKSLQKLYMRELNIKYKFL